VVSIGKVVGSFAEMVASLVALVVVVGSVATVVVVAWVGAAELGAIQQMVVFEA
jgi:hypothetical protein